MIQCFHHTLTFEVLNNCCNAPRHQATRTAYARMRLVLQFVCQWNYFHFTISLIHLIFAIVLIDSLLIPFSLVFHLHLCIFHPFLFFPSPLSSLHSIVARPRRMAANNTQVSWPLPHLPYAPDTPFGIPGYCRYSIQCVNRVSGYSRLGTPYEFNAEYCNSWYGRWCSLNEITPLFFGQAYGIKILPISESRSSRRRSHGFSYSWYGIGIRIRSICALGAHKDEGWTAR